MEDKTTLLRRVHLALPHSGHPGIWRLGLEVQADPESQDIAVLPETPLKLVTKADWNQPKDPQSPAHSSN